MTYIATFYSHFGAIRYKKLCDGRGIQGKMMPVPRNLSSSCGTCVRYEGELVLPEVNMREEIEQIVEVTETCYHVIYRAKDS